MSFVYYSYAQMLTAGNTTVGRPSLWASYNLALVTSAYTPDQSNDRFLSDIPGGAIVANGHAGTFPVLVMNFGPGGALTADDCGGLRADLAITPGVWSPVSASADQVVGVVFYGLVQVFPFVTQLIAYYDDWTGLPFLSSGADVNLNALPVSIFDPMAGDNMLRIATP